MSTINYLLFCILLILALGAVIAFSYFVIKPMQTRWAIVKARKIVETGQVPGQWQFRNVHRMLATANHDLEADKLWHKLDEMKASPGYAGNALVVPVRQHQPTDGGLRQNVKYPGIRASGKP